MKKVSTLILATLLLAAVGQAAQAAETEAKVMSLEATRAGNAINAQGLAMKKGSQNDRYFAVRAFADCPDGSIFVVQVGTDRGEYSVGVIKMFLNSGIFELKLGGAGDPDIGDIKEVTLTWGKNAILSGRFTSRQ